MQSFLIFIARLPELDAEPFFYPIAIVCLPRCLASAHRRRRAFTFLLDQKSNKKIKAWN